MSGMLVAALLRMRSIRARLLMGRLLAPTVAFSSWLFLETIRNIPAVGISAPGELRFRYLVLAAPLCLVLALDGDRTVKAAMKMFTFIAVAVPIALAPTVLYLNGWTFGPAHRIFPAIVSLGILLGLLTLWYCRSWVLWPKMLLYPLTVLGGLEIVVDAHRSVWLAAIVAIGILWVLDSRLKTIVRRLGLLLLGCFTATAIAATTVLDVWSNRRAN